MSTSDIILPAEAFEREQIEYHQKVRARLADTLKQETAKLKSCKPEELVRVQTWVAALEWMIKLPETILEEHRREKAKESPSRIL